MAPDERAIRELIATWLAASKAGDTEKVLSLMADDVVFLVPGRPPLRGKAEFAAAQKGALGEFSLEARSNVQEVRVLADWAYCWTQLTVVMTPRNGGAPVTRTGPTLSILHKQGAAWVLVRDANMLAAQAP